MTSSLKTARLELRQWVPAHDELLVAWSGDPDVVRFVGDGAVWPRERALDVAERQRAHWEEHGFGWRVAYAGDAAIGLIALSFAGENAGVDAMEWEIGWWLTPSAWRKGYAREGASALRDEAWRLGAPSIVARIQSANAPSIAVAEAIGCRYERDGTGRFGEPFGVYRAARP